MSEKIVKLNEEVIQSQLKETVRGSAEEPLNGRATAAGTTTETLMPDPAISHSMCPVSGASLYAA